MVIFAKSQLVTLAIVVIAVVAVGAVGAENLLSNPGFEIAGLWGDFADEWGFAPAGSVTYNEGDPAGAHLGGDYIKMVPGPNGWAVCWSAVDIPVAAGASYTMSTYIADANDGDTGDNLNGMAGMKLEWYANRSDPYDSRLDTDVFPLTVPKSGQYAQFPAQALNDSNASYARVVLTTATIAGQSRAFRFDDIRFGRTNPLAKPDFNADRIVNLVDFARFAGSWRQESTTCDIDGDGRFTGSDLGIFTREWMRLIPDYPGCEFVWSDEFDGVELSYANWAHEVGDSWYNGELQSYTARPENSYLENGNLVIVAREEQYHDNNYTSARIRSKSKQDFLYGRMAARIKLPKGKGIWPAFWMLPSYDIYGGWPDSGEIDIMEAINQMDTIYGTIHFSDAQGQRQSSGGSYSNGQTNYSDDFHVYSVRWEPNEICWFVDDIQYYSETEWTSGTNPYPAPFGEQFHFLLNVAVGGDWPGPPDGTTVFPQKMLVDWVRVYREVQ